MKDLIIIGAYCPDDERERLLNDCISSLINNFKAWASKGK